MTNCFRICAALALLTACGSDPVMMMDQDAGPTSPKLPAEVCLIEDCECGALENQGTIGPSPGEYGHWAAAEIQFPEAYLVDTVVLGVNNPTGMATCRGDIPTEVQIFVGEGPTPPAPPVVLWRTTPEPTSVPGLSFLELPVDPPIRIEADQKLYVAMQMNGSPDAHSCVYSCDNLGDEPAGRSWWSNAVEPDEFNWMTLGDFSVDSAYNVGVNGNAAP